MGWLVARKSEGVRATVITRMGGLNVTVAVTIRMRVMEAGLMLLRDLPAYHIECKIVIHRKACNIVIYKNIRTNASRRFLSRG